MTIASALAQAISDRLKTITKANGYATDIGNKVYRGKARIDPSNLPCCVIYEAGDKIDGDSQAPVGAGMVKAPLQDVKLMQRYFIEGHTECDPDNPNDDAHLIIGDLKKAMFGVDRSFGDKTRRLLYKGRAIGRREDGQAIINASIVIDAEIVENLANP